MMQQASERTEGAMGANSVSLGVTVGAEAHVNARAGLKLWCHTGSPAKKGKNE